MDLSNPENGIGITRALAGDVRGDFVVAFENDDGSDDDDDAADAQPRPTGPARGGIARVERSGRIAWVERDIAISYEVRLVPSPPDGNLLYADAAEHTARWLDPLTGRTLRVLGDERFDPYENRGVVVDYDGSILVLKRWDDMPTSLRRFTPDGAPLPVWPWQREVPDEWPGWDGLYTGGVVSPEPNARLAFGWDGSIFFYTDEAIAPITREGRVPRVIRFPAELVRNVYAVGSDRSGIVYALVCPANADVDARDVVRVMPNGQWHFWLGPQAPAAPSPIGPYDEHMAVMPHGTLLVACCTSLRVIAPDGRTVWRSQDAIERDTMWAEHLVPRRG